MLTLGRGSVDSANDFYKQIFISSYKFHSLIHVRVLYQKVHGTVPNYRPRTNTRPASAMKSILKLVSLITHGLMCSDFTTSELRSLYPTSWPRAYENS